MIKPLYISSVILVLLPACLPWDFDQVDFVQAITGGVQSVDFLSAKVEGSIAGLNTGTVSQYGHVWAPGEEEPDLNNSDHDRTDLGERTSEGNFISELSGLQLNTQYRYRAYARFAEQIVYGKINRVTTLDLELSAEVAEVSAGLLSKSLKANFEGPAIPVSDSLILRLSISEHGFIWSDSHDLPLLGTDNTILFGSLTNYGEFSSELDNLDDTTNYYMRAFMVIEGFDTLYSEVVLFHTFENTEWRMIDFVGERNNAYALRMNDGNVYIGGGQRNLLNGGLELETSIIPFNPVNNSFGEIGGNPFTNSPSILHYPSDFHFVIGETAYVSFNQRTKLASMHVSATGLPTIGVWNLKGDISGLGTETAWSFVLGNGVSSIGYLADETGNIWRFDPKLPLDSAWTLVDQLSVGLKVKGVLPFQNLNKVFFILEDESMQLLDLSQYPLFSWEHMPETQAGTEDFVVLMTELPKRVFICKDNPVLNVPYREVWEFVPASPTGEKWKRMPDFPSYLFKGTSFAFNDKAYIGLGQGPIGLTSPHLGYSLEMWEFTPPD